MKLAIGCDEAAYQLKKTIMEHLSDIGVEYEDYGAAEGETVLYPDIARKVAEAVAEGKYERGILVCGTGIGMAITANKVPGIRAAVCHDPYSAERARKSNDAQILCMGERVIGKELAKCLVDIWLKAEFSGGGSLPKVKRIGEVEQYYFDKVKNEVADLLREKTGSVDVILNFLMIAKYFERIGDHAENICEWVEFSKTGEYKDERII